ncbi:MAG: BrnA antitoxin family protein [Nitrospinae bacterium]|nr:BrnA antitoxin family protein [Nitrospinota bacterium]
MARKRKNQTLPEAEDRPLTKEMLEKMRPASEVVPEIVEAHARGELARNEPRRFRGPQKKPTKVQTTIRLDADVVAHFKKSGRGWQSRINTALRNTAFGGNAD